MWTSTGGEPGGTGPPAGPSTSRKYTNVADARAVVWMVGRSRFSTWAEACARPRFGRNVGPSKVGDPNNRDVNAMAVLL